MTIKIIARRRNDLDYVPYVHIETGACVGIALVERGDNDRHVCFLTLVEDDGNWFVKSDTQTSSFWLPEFVKVAERAMQWVTDNCDPDPSGFGWIFRNSEKS